MENQKTFDHFKKSYSYKMGGTQTVVLPNGKSRSFDDREYLIWEDTQE